MAISFIRVDDRIIHGQIIIRWSTEYPCDGIIAVDDKAAASSVIKSALLAASTKKTLIWSREKFCARMQEAVRSAKRYFVIARTPATMAELLVDHGLEVGAKVLNVGPQSAKPGTVSVNQNADITEADMAAYERIRGAGYRIEFQLVPDSAKVCWDDVREKLLRP